MVLEVVEDQNLHYDPPHLVMVFDKVIVCGYFPSVEYHLTEKTTENQITLFLNT